MQSTCCRISPGTTRPGDSRRPRWLVVATLATTLAACATTTGALHPRARFSSEDAAAVRAVLVAQQHAWNRGDLAGYMRGYVRSDALVFTSGSKIRRGWDATYAKYQARYGSDRSTMGTLAFEVLEIQALGRDGAIVLGRWALTDTPNAGRGVFSVALERTDQGWLVVHDHTSSDPPPGA